MTLLLFNTENKFKHCNNNFLSNEMHTIPFFEVIEWGWNWLTFLFVLLIKRNISQFHSLGLANSFLPKRNSKEKWLLKHHETKSDIRPYLQHRLSCTKCTFPKQTFCSQEIVFISSSGRTKKGTHLVLKVHTIEIRNLLLIHNDRVE